MMCPVAFVLSAVKRWDSQALFACHIRAPEVETDSDAETTQETHGISTLLPPTSYTSGLGSGKHLW